MAQGLRARFGAFGLALATAMAAPGWQQGWALQVGPGGRIGEPIALQVIASTSAETERLVRHLRRAMIEELGRTEGLGPVVYPAPPQLPAGTWLLTLDVMDLDKGSELLRFLIGWGLGSPTVALTYTLVDPNGVRAVAATRSWSTSDGTGFGAHSNPAYPEDVIDEAVAEIARDIADAVR